MKSISIIFISFFHFLSLGAQQILKGEGWEMSVSQKGNIEQIIYKNARTSDTIPFFKDNKNAGPSFYFKIENKEIITSWVPNGRNSYKTEAEGIECVINYIKHKKLPAIEITLSNHSHIPFQPQKAGLKFGIDTYMDQYPDWFGKYFPTLMRNERTHFYGYFQSPEEHVFALVSGQPVASWSVDYNLGYQDPPPHWFMGHRIESLNIDLLNQLPLPEHNPQDLYELKQGESRTWTFTFMNVGHLRNLEEIITRVADVPMISIERTTCNPLEEITFDVLGNKPEITVFNDQGKSLSVTIQQISSKKTQAKVILPEVGLYKINVKTGDKIAEAVLSARHSWQWTLEKAREAAWIYHQKPSSHGESVYGFYSSFIAQRYFPDKEQDRKLNDRFDMIFNKLHDTVAVKQVYIPNRIQNSSTFIGELVDKYEATGNIRDLEKAAKLADWLISNWQRSDGAYYNHGTVYTSVIYVAKSILELAVAEKVLGRQNPIWQSAYERHYQSAKRAIASPVSI